MSMPTDPPAVAGLEDLLTGDPEGIERDKLAQILNVVLNGARVAQAVLRDYHQTLNLERPGL